jgi:hypothetical protein
VGVIEGVKIPETEIARHERRLGNDLTALFKLIQDDMTDLLARAEREGWDEGRFIGEALKLVEGDGKDELSNMRVL